MPTIIINQLKAAVATNWKTTLAGVVAGALIIAGKTYTTGMTWQDWGVAIAVALVGILSRDFNVTSERSGAK